MQHTYTQTSALIACTEECGIWLENVQPQKTHRKSPIYSNNTLFSSRGYFINVMEWSYLISAHTYTHTHFNYYYYFFFPANSYLPISRQWCSCAESDLKLNACCCRLKYISDRENCRNGSFCVQVWMWLAKIFSGCQHLDSSSVVYALRKVNAKQNPNKKNRRRKNFVIRSSCATLRISNQLNFQSVFDISQWL